MLTSTGKYVAIEDEDNDDLHYPHKKPFFRTIWSRYWSYLTHGTLALLSMLFIGLWLSARSRSLTLPYSPANDVVEYYKELVAFNGAFNYSSIYRGNPRPELDAAWERVSTGVFPTRITKDQLSLLDEADTPSKVKYHAEDGGGYMAALEVTHQLHCLNTLRKYLHFDYYGQSDPFFTESKPATYLMHLEHCLDNLRQVIMCSADVGIITFEWVRGFSTPYPNFSTRHQCRNFEKIISWGSTRAVHPTRHVTRLEGEVDLPKAP